MGGRFLVREMGDKTLTSNFYSCPLGALRMTLRLNSNSRNKVERLILRKQGVHLELEMRP